LSRLRTLLEAGEPVLTAELPPLDTADAGAARSVVEPFLELADALNVGDNSGARARVGPSAASAFVLGLGGEPIMHLTCRDRNRLGLEAELLGAALLGVENVLCLTGDDVGAGDEPEAKRVFDLDALQLLSLAGTLMEGRFLSGRTLHQPPTFFLGAAENPNAPPFDQRADRAAKKARAGARFFQLQMALELDRLRAFLTRAKANGLTGRAHLLATVFVAAGARSLRYVRDSVPGVYVPDGLLERVARLPEREQAAACRAAALELAEEAVRLPGIRGLHVISFQGHEPVAAARDIVTRCGRAADWLDDGGERAE
jgi:methylenetetrahydrofolate reductase (NADPH)